MVRCRRRREREWFAFEMMEYARQELASGTFLKHIVRHILGLYQAVPGARYWRRTLSQKSHLPGADESVIKQALSAVEAAAMAAAANDVALP